MKEKIQELADTCWTEGIHVTPTSTSSFDSFDYEKFAQLIAKECARICDSHDSVDSVLIGNIIRRKFDISNG